MTQRLPTTLQSLPATLPSRTRVTRIGGMKGLSGPCQVDQSPRSAQIPLAAERSGGAPTSAFTADARHLDLTWALDHYRLKKASTDGRESRGTRMRTSPARCRSRRVRSQLLAWLASAVRSDPWPRGSR